VAARTWAGVDVGGRRKGFHLAVVDGASLVDGPVRLPSPRAVVERLRESRPRLIAVDSPRVPAPAGLASRPCERVFAAAGICSLRYTPDRRTIASNPHYGWIAHGLALYAALARAGFAAIECFPTASWTRWLGPRGVEPRGAWSRRALAGLDLRRVPERLSQDDRDAIGAALTARAHEAGRCERFGDIVVPRREGRRGAH
jgi:predicted nuclease with RNAse H fold